MSTDFSLKNAVRQQRLARGWTQEELARRSGISRAEVSAIETDRVSPSAAVALILAGTFECRVEDLFQLASAAHAAPTWAWPPSRQPSRYWRAEVNRRTLTYPVESNGLGVQPADGTFSQGQMTLTTECDPSRTLVLACCDPAVGLLAHEMMKSHCVRLLVISRSSRAALNLLRQGLVHLAGVHLAGTDDAGNARAVRNELGPGYRLIRATRWRAGLAIAPGRKVRSVRGAIGSNLRWVGREVGSGARQCLDDLLGKKATFRRLASDHRGVAEAIRCGWAEVGVTLQLTSEEAGLDFLSVRQEPYDLCYRADCENDPRLIALLQVIRSVAYRGELAALPGYDSASTGEVQDAQ